MRSDVRSWLSGADPRIKLIWFVVLAFATVAPLKPYAFVVLALVPPIAFIGGVHRFAPWLTLVTMPLFLVALGLASLMLDPLSSALGVASLLLRWSAVIYGALLFATATQPQEAHFLIRWTRLPMGFGIAAFFAIRSVPVALEQLSGLIRTMRARGQWPLSWSWRASGKILELLPELLLALLVAGTRRTDQMWVSLELRGGWTRAPVLFSFAKHRAASWLLMSHGIAMVGAVGLSLWGGF